VNVVRYREKNVIFGNQLAAQNNAIFLIFSKYMNYSLLNILPFQITNAKQIIYKKSARVCVLPVLLYGLECWSFTIVNGCRLDVLDSGAYRDCF